MSNASDFIIENGVLKKYVGSGGDVVIPNGVVEIGENSFSQCTTLTSISMGIDVQLIGNSAFFWCRNLEKVEIGPCVSEIGMFAFNHCSNLKSIEIPESVRMIDAHAFSETLLNLVSIMGSQTQIHSSAFNGMGNWALICAPNLSLEKIPKAVKYNAALGFFRLWSDHVKISPEAELEYAAYIRRIKKKLIDEYVLYHAQVHALQYLTQHGLIKRTEIDDLIEKTQKAGYAEMTSILMAYLNAQFGTGIEKFIEREEEKAKETAAKERDNERRRKERKDQMTDFKRLWTVKKLPDGTCKISAYKGALEELVFPEEIDGCPISEIGHRGNVCLNEEGFQALKRVVLPASLRAIGRNVFSSSSLEEITIPEGVTKIEKELFAHCHNLRSVKLPASLEKIDSSAFIFCKNLQSINIPAKIVKVSREMFNTSRSGGGCGNLKNITIEGKATILEKEAFAPCLRVKDVISCRDDAGNLSERAEIEYTLTIHAPAGSYAEAYAKENNIPFVTE